jgi:large subunit ribosomal protein L6
MSRVGKKPIAIPEKTEVKISGSTLTITGPQGTLTRTISPVIDVKVGDKELLVTPKNESNEANVLWGTNASHIKNMLSGVTTPYQKKLMIEGVGFKWEVKGDTLAMSLGFSHPVNIKIPATVKVAIEKGVFVATSIDKDALGQFVAYVRAQRKPEPFKGKGIRYENEVIRRKEGKKTA